MGVKFGTEEGKFGMEEVPVLHAKFHPHRCNVSPLRGEKPQNRPLSKLNTGRLALRAMLPVTRNRKYRLRTGSMRKLPNEVNFTILLHFWGCCNNAPLLVKAKFVMRQYTHGLC